MTPRRRFQPLVVLAGAAATFATFSVAAVVAPRTALAANCGTFRADDGDNVIVYGEWLRNDGGFPLTQKLGVCWKDASGDWSFEEVPGCNFGTPSTDQFVIYAEGGNDVVVPSVRESPGMDFVCPDSTYNSPVLGPMYIYPGDIYNPNADTSICRARDWGCVGPLSFGVKVYGGTGEDEIHGSPNDDMLYANEPQQTCFTFAGRRVCWDSSYPSDDSSDVMCAYGGVDDLYADETIDRKRSACLDGGLGPDADMDVCMGGNGNVDRANELTCTDNLIDANYAAPLTNYAVDACCSTHQDAGCAPNWSREVESCVCALDSYCCNNAWDSLCVSEVDTFGCGTCSGPSINGCYDVCQHEVDDISTSDTWVVPPLYRIMEDSEGPGWIGRFGQAVVP